MMDWNDIVPALLGAVGSLIVGFIWVKMPPAWRFWWTRKQHGFMAPRQPWEAKDTATAMADMVEYSTTRIFVIRLGELKLSEAKYEAAMSQMIEADHIWDWHFFMETLENQEVRKWLRDFFETDDKGKLREPLKLDEQNSTTQVGVLYHEQFRENASVRKLFSEMGMADDLDFDDLTIYGTIQALSSYPEFGELVSQHLNKVTVKEIHIYYPKKETKVREINCYQQEFGVKLLKMIADLYDKKNYLYIDQPADVSEEAREKAEGMARQVMKANHA